MRTKCRPPDQFRSSVERLIETMCGGYRETAVECNRSFLYFILTFFFNRKKKKKNSTTYLVHLAAKLIRLGRAPCGTNPIQYRRRKTAIVSPEPEQLEKALFPTFQGANLAQFLRSISLPGAAAFTLFVFFCGTRIIRQCFAFCLVCV